MLKGRFEDATGAPIVEGHVAFPRLDRRGGVFFLVDTGADGTVIMPGDCDKLEIDTGTLVNPTTSRGIGGTSGGFIERVVLSFSDEQYRYVYVLKIEISAPTSFNCSPSAPADDCHLAWSLTLRSNPSITATRL